MIWKRDKRYKESRSRYLGAAVIGPTGLEGSHFVPGVHVGSRFFPDLRNLAFSSEKWVIPLADYGARNWGELELLARDGKATLPPRGVAIAEFDAAGATEPRIILPDVVAEPWLFPGDHTIDLFWTESWLPWYGFPDSGHDLHGVKHARIKQDQPIFSRVVYQSPAFPKGLIEWRHQILRLRKDRYDMVLSRHRHLPWADLGPESLMHVRDLASRSKDAGAKRIANAEAIATFLALPLGNDGIQVVWLEEETNPDPSCGEPALVRLVAVHYDGDSWSRRRVLAQHLGWKEESLAAVAIPLGGRNAVLVVWKDENGHLAYTIGIPPDKWSAPRSTDLTIGDRNWLAYSDGYIVLVTKRGPELYWSYLRVQSGRAGSTRRD
ncbi:MAG: hypothetical protein JSU86_04910 [Phycisphaerales bacterium]|nr:MAG: hypothetical protein JSU86_04910 [Phycisphaerales bacterium]